jgi:WD40 repeat protein
MQGFQDIFISYGRRDSLGFASRLNRCLLDRGFTVWFDYDNIPLGVDYQKQIDDGIERAENFVFIISPHSINSPYCALELKLALKYQKRIIPWLHVERISYDTWQERNLQGTAAEWDAYQAQGLHDHFQNMHPVLRKLNWIYGREGQDDFGGALAGLLEICDRHQEYVHQHTWLLVKALEWERNQKRSSYLLVGEERLLGENWLKVHFKDVQPPCLPTLLHCEFISESRKNADNLMTEVFLAYADDNEETANQIRDSLRREGFTVWSNTTDIQAGSNFQQLIDRGIEETDNVVYLLSPAAVRSPHCQEALAYALSLHKRIIPVLVETIAADQIPLQLRNVQYIDLTDNVQESDYALDESQLLKVLRQDATYHNTHKRLLTKALKWDRQHRNPTLLLRGYNLKQAEAWLKLAQQVPTYPALPLQEIFVQESLRQPPGLSLDVFISYSRADSGFARRLNDALQLQSKRTWFDQESIAAGTADFQQEIHRGIESADIFLFILSPRSIASPYCADEVDYAARLNKRLVTLLYQPIDTQNLHPELAKVQWLNFSRNEDFSASFTALLRILDTDSDHLHTHTRLLLRAIEWDEKGRRESLLLRGDELEAAEGWLSQSGGKEPQPTELQRSYLHNSRSVEDANQQAEQILRAAAAKGRLLGAIAGSLGLGIAAIAAWFAVQAQNRLQTADLKLQITDTQHDFVTGQPFPSLLKALKASQTLRTQFGPQNATRRELQPRIMGSLQQAIYRIREQNSLEGHEDWVGDVSFSPDGQTIASASGDGTIKLWNVETGEILHTLKGHQGAVLDLSFSPDGQTIASASDDQTVKLWTVATGELIHSLEGHQDWIRSLSFSPDGQTIVSASDDQTLKLWAVKTGTLIQTLSGHQALVSSIRFSPDGQTIASASDDRTVKLWDGKTGALIRTLAGHQGEIWSIRFSRDGKTLASGSGDKTIKLWDVQTGGLIHTLVGHQDIVRVITFSPDGTTIASGSAGNTFTSGSLDTNIKLWDVKTGQVLYTLAGHQDGVVDLTFSPNGKMLASGSRDYTIKLWSVPTGKEIDTLKGHLDWVSKVIFSPDGHRIVSGSSDNTVKIWQVETVENRNTLAAHQDEVWAINFSADGKTIASGSADQTIKLWNAATGSLMHTLTGHQDWVGRVNFSPDGQTIASGSGDKTVRLWNAATGTLLHTLAGHQDWVGSISFSPDGQTIASGSGDKTIRLWSVATGALLHTLTGHQDWVGSIAFSPDGQTIASASDDGTVKLWVWDFDRLTQMGCNWIQYYSITHPEDRYLCDDLPNL